MDDPHSRIGKPAALVLRDIERWWEIRDAIVRELAADATIRTRIRAGAILTSTSTVVRVAYGEHKPGEGRSERYRTMGHQMAVERDRDAHLSKSLHSRGPSHERSGAWGTLQLLGRDAFTFSNLDDPTLESLVALPLLRDNLVAHGHFDGSDPIQHELLWAMMSPILMVTDGWILEALEDEGDIWSDWSPVLPAAEGRRHGGGVFEESLGFVRVDESSLEFPVPLPIPALTPTKAVETPIGMVMSRMTRQTGPRISSQDRPLDDATVSRSLAIYEFADVNAVENKVRDFLLNPTHAMARWRDFADHGWRSSRDELLLAARLASVHFNDFTALDIRPTADGAVQFTVPVILPSARRWMPMTTSWVYRDGPRLHSSDLDDQPPGTVANHGLRLATAHVDYTHEEYATPLASPFGPDTPDWEALVHYAEMEAKQALTRYAASGMATTGFLWIPRLDGRQADFYAWIRRNRDVHVYTRRAYGRPVALYAPDIFPSFESETGVSAAMRRMQTLLGMAGLRSHVSLHFD